jgi:hypothetical protein
VELRTKASPNAAATNTITLNGVLHVPDYIYNIIGRPIAENHEVVFNHGQGGIFTPSGQQLAYFVGQEFYKITVETPAGCQFGPLAF